MLCTLVPGRSEILCLWECQRSSMLRAGIRAMYTLHHAALPGQSSLMAAVNLKKKRVCNASLRLAFSIDIGDLCSMKSHMRRVEFC